MKILVTGANGQLGMSLRHVLLSEAKNLSFVFTDVVEGPDTEFLDITDKDAVMAFVKENDIDTIVNCAGYTNVDKAEEEPEKAELLNATAVGYLADVMKEVGGLLVHISTDYVFGGEQYNTPITEGAEPCPTGVYGVTKLRGEEAVKASGCRSVIIRTAWLYSEWGKNFVKTMLRLTSEKPSLNVVFDQVGTPTYAGDLANAIVTVLCHSERSEESVVYHYSNEGVCSWYDFAKAIAEYSGHTDCDIQPCHSSEFPSPVHRPSYSVLDKTKIKETFGIKIPHWTESLRRCISKMRV